MIALLVKAVQSSVDTVATNDAMRKVERASPPR